MFCTPIIHLVSTTCYTKHFIPSTNISHMPTIGDTAMNKTTKILVLPSLRSGARIQTISKINIKLYLKVDDKKQGRVTEGWEEECH